MWNSNVQSIFFTANLIWMLISWPWETRETPTITTACKSAGCAMEAPWTVRDGRWVSVHLPPTLSHTEWRTSAGRGTSLNTGPIHPLSGRMMSERVVHHSTPVCRTKYLPQCWVAPNVNSSSCIRQLWHHLQGVTDFINSFYNLHIWNLLC